MLPFPLDCTYHTLLTRTHDCSCLRIRVLVTDDNKKGERSKIEYSILETEYIYFWWFLFPTSHFPCKVLWPYPLIFVAECNFLMLRLSWVIASQTWTPIKIIGLLKHRLLGVIPRVSDSVGLTGPGISISNKLLDNANASSLGTTLYDIIELRGYTA